MRLIAALALLLLAPFTGELLLGNLPADPVQLVFILPQLILLYGGGALLIREVARRLGRGYPTMAMLAVAYGLLEEGIVVGTLFNPDFLGQGLLDYGWIPALGTSPVWALYVLGIHTVWSILVPIVLTERLFPAWVRQPWLRTPGLLATALFYLVGAAVLTFGTVYTYQSFASLEQVAGVLVLAAMVVLIAVRVPGSRLREGPAPAPSRIALITFLGGSAFIGVQGVTVHPALTVALMLIAITVTAALVIRASAAAGWSSRHAVAAAAGAIATYCWAGFMVQLSTYGVTTAGLIAQCGYVAVAVLVVMLAHRRSLRGPRAAVASAATV